MQLQVDVLDRIEHGPVLVLFGVKLLAERLDFLHLAGALVDDRVPFFAVLAKRVGVPLCERRRIRLRLDDLERLSDLRDNATPPLLGSSPFSVARRI